MKRRLRRPFLTAFKLILIGLLVSLIVIVSVFILNRFNYANTPITPLNEKYPYEFTLIDYEIYQADDVNFGFIVANIDVSSTIPLQLDLSSLVTDEGISLDKTDDYLAQLASNNLKPGHESLSFSINTTETHTRIYVFIPFLDKTDKELIVSSKLEPFSQLNFDLTNPSKLGNVNNLIISTVTKASDDLTFKVTLVDIFNKTNFYTLAQDGQYLTVDFSGNTNIYGVKLSVINSSQTDYKVSNAFLSVNMNTIELLNPDIMLQGKTNLTKLNLLNECEGILFFEVIETLDLFNEKDNVTLILEFTNGDSITLEDFIQ